MDIENRNKMGLSIASPGVEYRRTFEAEIDVLTDDLLLVRGRMRDHRFDLEHVWKLKTPDYEVIEAGARQFEGDPSQFDPNLCDRYAGIKGVKIGRGFSKHIISALGDLAGRQEHLWLAIEMARIGQQVYQYTPEFEARFPQIGGDPREAARIAWMKDRAYMADLANSCYTYRDESAALFETRSVRCGFGPELFMPRPGDKRVFWREKRLSITTGSSADGRPVYSCENAMDDRIHDIRIGFDLTGEGVISNAHSYGLRLPYHGICEDAQLRTSGLNGLRVTGGFILQFANSIGGPTGCTHLFDLAIDCLRVFTFR